MIEELTNFEIKKIFGEGQEPSTYKLLYDLILDLQKQINEINKEIESLKKNNSGV